MPEERYRITFRTLHEQLTDWWTSHREGVDQPAVIDQVVREGGLSYTFVFLVIGSSAIATLGLLLNSAAVVIGAMLVAPLLGPITLFGFSIAMTDVTLAVRSFRALIVGTALGLLTSMVIVRLSPGMPAASEILARTSPNFFDLLVAIFAGLVGGYAVIHRLGGTIAGVAIATALVPPLAASGYGLAAAEFEIFQGAFYLFLTNLLAISFSVAAQAIWYNFGNLKTRRELIWPTLGAAVVLGLLSIPLINTLNETVRKTLASKQVAAVLRAELEGESRRLDRFELREGEEGALTVTAVVFAPSFDRNAKARVEKALEGSLGRPVRLILDQILVGQEAPVGSTLSPAARSVSDERAAQVRRLRDSLPFPVAVAEVDGDARRATFQIGLEYEGELETVRRLEQTLRRLFPNWDIVVVPPLRPLPRIFFEPGEVTIGRSAAATLDTVSWSLARWGVRRVRVLGQAAIGEVTGGVRQTGDLAERRAREVSGRLADQGFLAMPASVYPIADQRGRQAEQGATAFRTVSLEPVLEVDADGEGAPAR